MSGLTYAILIIIIAVVVYISNENSNRNRDKEQWSKEISKIEECFKGKRAQLFFFDKVTDASTFDKMFVLIEFDSRRDDYLNPMKHQNFYILAQSGNERLLKYDEDKVMYIRSLLPSSRYDFTRCNPFMTWEKYYRERQSYITATNLKHQFPTGLKSCYAVLDNDHHDRLVFIAFGDGKPFKKGTEYWDFYYQDEGESQESSIREVNTILKRAGVKEVSIQKVNKTWEQMFANYTRIDPEDAE